MPSKVSVFDSTSGITALYYGLYAREMVSRDPGRYSITDNSAEVAAQKGRGVRKVSHTALDSRARRK